MRTLSSLLTLTLLSVSTNSYPVEITPILGYRGGGEVVDASNDKKHTIESSEVYGLILSFPYEYGKTIEVYYSHQDSALNSINVSAPTLTGTTNIPLTIDYLHVGGTAPISEQKDLQTFVSGGLGFTYLSPDFTGAQSDMRASLSIGIGLKWPMTERVALRLETRGLATMFDNNSAILCSGGCTIQVSGNFFFQAEVLAGLAIKF